MGSGTFLLDNGANPYRSSDGHERPLSLHSSSYTGALLTFVGLGLASRTWGGTFLIVALFGLVYGYRMDVEEKGLKTEFGQAYVDYVKKTKRLIPFLL